jgi:hypothetical protein
MCDPQPQVTATTRFRGSGSSSSSGGSVTGVSLALPAGPQFDSSFSLVLLSSPNLATQALTALRRCGGTHWNRAVRERAKAVALRLSASAECSEESLSGLVDSTAVSHVGLKSPRSQLLAAAVSTMLSAGTQCTTDAVVGGASGTKPTAVTTNTAHQGLTTAATASRSASRSAVSAKLVFATSNPMLQHANM